MWSHTVQTVTGKRLEKGGTCCGKKTESSRARQSNCTMAPRKPKPQDSVDRVHNAEYTSASGNSSGAKDLIVTLSALLQLNLSSADAVSDLCLPQLNKLAELIRHTSLLGLWETSKKRLPLVLSNLCDWALLQAATPFDILGGAAAVFCLCQIAEKQCPKDEATAAQVLVKELLRLDIPSKLFRAALAAHERACERPCLAHDMDLPPAATPASGDVSTKTWVIRLASSVAGATQAARLAFTQTLMFVSTCESNAGAASLVFQSRLTQFMFFQCLTHLVH